MKRIFGVIALVCAVAMSSCNSKFDDGDLWNSVNGLEDRVSKLERLCGEMNTNITALQTIVGALQTNDYVTGVTPIMQGGKEVGYTITFTKSNPITIYHGKDGQNGTDGKDGLNGTDGKDGADGITPVIGVKQDADNIYYWTLNGEWLTDAAGNKIKAQGIDGKNGQNGQDGAAGSDGKDGQDGQNGQDGKDAITPQLKIEDDYWFISYDNGTTWVQLGRATGENGKDGINGDSFFKSVIENENEVVLTLADNTVIAIPKHCKKLVLYILDSQAYEFKHSAIVTNQEISLRWGVRYQNFGEIKDCQVEAFGSGGMSALVTYDTNNTSAPYSIRGSISIKAGDEVTKYSRVTIIASDGESYAMKNITFEQGELYMSDDAVITVPAAGGDVELNFMSNLDCEVYSDKFWIDGADRHETRTIAKQSRTITIAENNSQARTGEVIVKDKNSDMQIVYTINQEASPNYLKARAALVDLYNATNGDQWTIKTNWCSDEPINNWYGVFCKFGSWQISLIDLQSNNLSGTIPSSIGDLTELQTLSLSSNNLYGELPSTLGNCTKLEDLLVHQNKLSGILPESLGNCTELWRADLSDNQFSGALPASIGRWGKIEVLNLSKNQFTTIPDEISKMSALQQLDLYHNNVVNIPASISELKSLVSLNLSHNALEMEFPISICALEGLKYLYLDDNKIYGCIPSDIGKMSNLVVLSMGQTYLSGEIPDELYDCTNLHTIDLGHYHMNALGEHFDKTYIPNYKGLSGVLSEKIANLTKLTVLGLGDNDLSGEIPSAITKCVNLENLYLSDNRFSGAIPTNIGDLQNLTYLELSGNSLSGAIPPSLWSLTAMRNLLLAGGSTLNGSPTGQPQGTNLFTGELPEEIGNMVNLQQLYITDTNMTGSLPNAMLDLPQLNDCLLTGNRFSGILSKAFTNTVWWSDGRILSQQYGYGLTVEGE